MERSNIESVILNVDKMLTERGISITEFCDRAGITPGAYRHWRNGARTPTNKSIKAMADALEVPVEYLLQEPTGWKVIKPRDKTKRYETGIAEGGTEIKYLDIISSLETFGDDELRAIVTTASAILQERKNGLYTDPDSLRTQRGEK